MSSCRNLILIFSLVFVHLCCLSTILCFHVNFRENYDVKVEPFNTQTFKREMSQFFDKASYTFNGFQKVESIPVTFPMDICILNLEGRKYAACLHKNTNGVHHFSLYKMDNGTYSLLTDLSTPAATAMDCKSFGMKGYIALAYNISTPIENAREGSPIFEISSDRLHAVQYFSTPNLLSVYLRVTGNDLFLLQTHSNTKSTPNLYCPYFKWSGSTFNKLGRIPCSNARHLEPFSIEYESYVAVANYADQRGRTTTNSEIYKFIPEKNKFQLFQKIKTSGAVDVKHFRVPFDEVKRQHFLVFGNSISTKSRKQDEQLEADSIFYVYDKGQFVPYQRLPFYSLEQFLPVQNIDAEKFLLLVASNNQDTKIYNLNDWKFEESTAQFTEGALSRGVAKMRIYQENDNSYLVIANELMMGNETNVFLPIFKQDEHANALRQQIIDWAKTNMERLASVDVQQLKQAVEQKLSKNQSLSAPMEVKDIHDANIQSAVTESLVYPRLHMSPSYWKALSYANQALDVLQKKFVPRRHAQKREVHEKANINPDSVYFEDLEVDTLIVRNKMTAQWVNGVKRGQLQFDHIKADKIIVTGEYKGPGLKEKERMPATENYGEINDMIEVENLQISGNLNDFSWKALVNNTLKRRGAVQFLKAPVAIGQLKAPTVVVTTEEVSERDLGKLIPINGDGSYVINQDIQFAAPVTAKDVVIHERLNNIHVFKQKFDVLLKRSNVTQVIEGAKHFDSLRVLEPITIAGELLGQHLRAMSPNKAIHETLFLNGDYIITGDVTITKLLSADDIIIDSNSNISMRAVLENAVRFNETVEDVNIHFEQPLTVNNSMVTFINAQDLQQLLKMNTEEVQVVEGSKTFAHGLEIQRGFSEVKNLNGIDVEGLEKGLLLKHTNETIRVPMQFGTIIAKGAEAEIMTLADRNLSEYLTKSGVQHIHGSLKVGQLHAQTLNIENLNTNGAIFNRTISDIYQQKARSAPSAPDIFRKDRKFDGTIYVKNLRTNATINGRPVHELERQLSQLDGNIKYVGNFKFNYNMNITNLTFDGRFNGLPADEFGRCWLQKTDNGLQTFTAPQTIAAVSCNAEDGVVLEGKLNGFKMDDLFVNTYWINRNEHIANALFENPLQMQGVLWTNSLNELRVPDDILYGTSAMPQILHAEASVAGDLQLRSDVAIANISSSVNGLNLEAFQYFLNGYGDTLHVEHANFVESAAHPALELALAPAIQYSTLNQHNLKETLDAVWLANENVNLKNHVEIAEGYFQGLLEFEGHVNNMNMQYLKENYFSRTRPQEITAEHIFAQGMTVEGAVQANEMHVHGPIAVLGAGKSQLNFNDFVANTLKLSGPHEIHGIWNMSAATIVGDFMGEINNLNFAQDVLRVSVDPSQPIEITAPKYLNSSTIRKLYATPTSTVNGVPVDHWIQNTVYVYENYTIRGQTTVDTVNVYNDLSVQGTVNGVRFDAQSLLLRDSDQTIRADVKIRNTFPERQRILVNNFENLQASTVNGMSLEQLMRNQAQQAPALQIQSHLVFAQPLIVEEYQGQDLLLPEPKWKRNLADDNTDWGSLENTVKMLKNLSKVAHHKLDHFEVRQTLPLNTTRLIPLSLRVNGELVDYICLLTDTENDHLRFYRWREDLRQLVEDQNLTAWRAPGRTTIDIIKLVFDNADYVTIGQPMQALHENILGAEQADELRQLLHMQQERNGQIESFPLQDESCFALYGGVGEAEVRIYCLSAHGTQPTLTVYHKDVIRRRHVQQIVALEQEHMLALLVPNAVELWSTAPAFELHQRLALLQPTRMAYGHREGRSYLAFISHLKPNTLHHGAVEIYSSTNGTHFEHLQALDIVEPRQVAFSSLNASDDLLLHVLTATADQPLLVYQYKGVVGFQEIVGASTLRAAADGLHVMELRNARRHLIALLGKGSTTFVEIMLQRF